MKNYQLKECEGVHKLRMWTDIINDDSDDRDEEVEISFVQPNYEDENYWSDFLDRNYDRARRPAADTESEYSHVDWDTLLSLADDKMFAPPRLGSWVRVMEGTYKDGVGRIATLDDGAPTAEIDLVPRLTTKNANRTRPEAFLATIPGIKALFPREDVTPMEWREEGFPGTSSAVSQCNDMNISGEPSGRVPWLNTKVLIVGAGDAWKGQDGVVTDVLLGQNTPSGLRVCIQENAGRANPTLRVLDYDSVFDAEYGACFQCKPRG